MDRSMASAGKLLQRPFEKKAAITLPDNQTLQGKRMAEVVRHPQRLGCEPSDCGLLVL
ncbi:MAG: hypothetical protein JWS10_133 [Cypionkella sp.]|uniref:hypothetical protein n=1 Tax=Cypionkella sp. TaxID=2811411 RepID=UPI002620F06F|nr:hypothetical protein [Cypionkella sp.]MDB5657518.1 hypothetical protein [Cypionkella sp.]